MSSLRQGMHVHLVGIGGIGLSAIARVLHGWGYTISGSDRQPSALTEALAGEGILVYTGHHAANVAGADLVVISSAIPSHNPEVEEAKRLGLPIARRSQFLADLTRGKMTIAIAGTHGKTTTTAMIAWMLTAANLDPTFVVGGVLQNLGTNAAAGRGRHFVIEADEYDRAFLGLRPDVAVITTLEHDHPDCYPTLGDMQAAYGQFVDQIVPGGVLIASEDDRARELAQAWQARAGRLTIYGLGPAWDWHAEQIRQGATTEFEVWHAGERLGSCGLQLAGCHNVSNALAALAVAQEVGIEFRAAAEALAEFRGTERRFEVKGQAGGVTIVDDYAHHPTEIRATLAAARARYSGRPLWAVFQPHTYSRTAALLDQFGTAFGDADHVLVIGIYAAREHDTLGMSGSQVAERIRQAGHPDASYVEQLDEAVAVLLERAQADAVVLTLGAGDGYLVGDKLLEALEH